MQLLFRETFAQNEKILDFYYKDDIIFLCKNTGFSTFVFFVKLGLCRSNQTVYFSCVASALKQRVIYFSPECKDTLREFSLYKWDDKAVRDAPRKENDHAMDDLRYFVTTALNAPENDFFVMSVSR